MTIDLNGSSEQIQQRYDLDELTSRLRDRAFEIYPALFPMARYEGHELRMADITGRAPRDSGSCVVELKGPNAGDWYDHQKQQGAGPLDLLAHATGLWGRELFEKAAELVNLAPDEEAQQPSRRRSRPRKLEDRTLTIASIVRDCLPAKDTLVETYLRSRGFDLPEDCPDILYHFCLTDGDGHVGWPAMVTRPRNPVTGEFTGGVHRCYLQPDGNGKAPIPKPKLTLGPIGGGVAMLMPMVEGCIGIAEGIETALAAFQLFHIPVWAGLSDSGLAHMPFPEELRKLVIFADRGDAGEKAAATLRDRALAAKIEVEIRLPQGDDDFAKDLTLDRQSVYQDTRSTAGADPAADTSAAETARGPEAPPADTPPVPEIALPPSSDLQNGPATPRSLEEILRAAATFTRETPASWITPLLRQAVAAGLEDLEQSQVLQILKRRTGQPIAILQNALKAVKREIAPAAPKSDGGPAWGAKLTVFESGEPRQTLHNVSLALREAPEWQGVLGFDSFRSRPMILRPPPWDTTNDVWRPRPSTDDDTRRATIWLQSPGICIQATELVVNSGILTVAAENSYHPVRNYLNSLRWDRRQRLDILLPYYFGTADSRYIRAVGARWMISGVARIFRPGVKADCCLVLEGPQGIMKSTALRILCDPLDEGWFTDELAGMGTKDAAEQTVGIWVIEVSELDAVNRAGDWSRVKSFMSRTTDRFRWSYGRSVQEFPRQCVFAATSNNETWNCDETGGRRFWPARCTKIDTDALFHDRDQLWAEAVRRYEAGEKWYLHEQELIEQAAEEQAERVPEDPREKTVADFIAKRGMTGVTTAEVLQELGYPNDRKNHSEAIKIGSLLKRVFKWKKLRDTEPDGRRCWRYYPPESNRVSSEIL